MPPEKTSSACCHGTTRNASSTVRPTTAPMSRGSAFESAIVSHVWMTNQMMIAASAAHTFFGSMLSIGRVYSDAAAPYSRGPR